ncbi:MULTISPECIES: ABC transporter ATP-binding protein [unclassified Actinotignum]|uniref:ABC transporter ATP-binding protein n=1 Tax=unclassified Actinotignum TaxID=2632702 RepID=UPI003F47BADA
MNTAQNVAPDLVANNLTKDFGNVAALRQVSLRIPGGQSVAIMGPSGSGKSTLLHCLAGIIAPTTGTVLLGNEPISDMSDGQRSKMRLENFGFVFQDGQLVPELPARENVAVPLLLQGKPRREALAAADMWLARLGVEPERHRRPGEMSGGQLQRVAIARALAGQPAVVFADEPTGALDQATGHEVTQILTTAAKMSGATLIIVTHDPNVAAWCERLVEIRDGVIHADSANAPAAEQPSTARPGTARPSAPQPGTTTANGGELQ